MLRDGDRVPVRLERDQQPRVGRGDVDPLDDFGPLDEALELGDGQAGELALLAFGQLGHWLLLVRVVVVVGVGSFRGSVFVRVNDFAFRWCVRFCRFRFLSTTIP